MHALWWPTNQATLCLMELSGPQIKKLSLTDRDTWLNIVCVGWTHIWDLFVCSHNIFQTLSTRGGELVNIFKLVQRNTYLLHVRDQYLLLKGKRFVCMLSRYLSTRPRKLVNIFILRPNLLPWKAHSEISLQNKREPNKQALHSGDKRGNVAWEKKASGHHCSALPFHIRVLFLGHKSVVNKQTNIWKTDF